MASKTQQSTFSLNLDGNAGEVSEKLASSLEHLRERVAGGESSIKDMSAALRGLRGAGAEVKAAKDQLRAKINAERDAISAANLAALRAGTSLEKLNRKSRDAAKAQADLKKKLETKQLEDAKKKSEALGAGLAKAGGPLASLKTGLADLKEFATGAGGGMRLASLAAAGLVATLAAVVAGTMAAGVALARFIIGSADAARSAQLFREGAAQGAANATNLGQQVAELARKVPMGEDAINELGSALAKTRLSGNAIVDTMNLVAQASSAAGDETGSALKEIVLRGQQAGRLQINPQELWGKGIDFEGVASELASQMHVSVKDAQKALFEGRVKIDDGAKAIRAAVDKRFGEINARKMLSLDVQLAKFQKTLAKLASGVNLEALLRGLDKMSSLVDESTVTGAALKQLVTAIGNGLSLGFEKAGPLMVQFVKGTIIATLRIGVAFLKLRKRVRETFGGSDVLRNVNGMKLALKAGEAAVYGIALSFATLAAVIAPVAVQVYSVVTTINAIVDTGKKAYAFFAGGAWKSVGASVVDGIIEGISSGPAKFAKGMTDLAKSGLKSFKDVFEIRSPSKAMKREAKQIPAGGAQGVEEGAPEMRSALAEMAAPSDAGRSGGGGARGITVNVPITINAGGGGGDAANIVQAPSFAAALSKAIEDFLVGQGIPVT